MRHAESVRPELGKPDFDARPLRADGFVAAQELVPQLVGYAPVAVLSSPLLRAVQTVAPAAAALGLAVETWPELREWESGLLPSADFAARYAYSWAHPGSSYGGGESLDEVTVRAGKALARVAAAYPDATVVVGSHGTFLSRALIASGRHVDWDFGRTLPMPAIYEVTW